MGAGAAKVNNNTTADFLQRCPISILNWNEELTIQFSNCFKNVQVKPGKEVKTTDDNTFFVVAQGGVEVIAVLPTISKKTDNIREFLCKKKEGDMVYIPSVKQLISESNRREMSTREKALYGTKKEHKNILQMIDSVNILSMTGATLLMLKWEKYHNFEAMCKQKNVDFNLGMLNALMQTNIVDYLQRLPFLKVVPSGKLEILSSMCNYELKGPGGIVCKEGETGDKVYMILSGSVKVEAHADTQRKDALVEKSPMASSAKVRRGSITLDAGKANSAACDYKAAPRHTLRAQMQKLGSVGKGLLSPATPVIKEEGSKSTEPQDVQLATLYDGEYFGEMAAFIELPRAATVTSLTSCLFATLSKSDFRSFLKVVPDMQNQIEFMVKQHMLQNLIQLKSPFLQSVSIAKAHGMASKSIIEQYKAKDVIFKEGEAASKFYFVYSGSLKVDKTKNDKICTVGHLYPGDYFGELALINDNPRLATIVATNDTILLGITKSHFHECFEDKPDLLSEFIVRMNGRNVSLNVLLDHKMSREAFVNHLKSEHGQENLRFYELARHFEKNFVYMSDEEAYDSATRIVNNHILPDSPECVNLPSKIANAISTSMENHDLHEDTFSKAQEEIYNLMNRDLYQRFKKSDAFNDLMQLLHTYDDIDIDFTV
ncbi:hypothetical protein TrVE_jg4979 [Triparma verrucosa]|uniref:Uncharacterized protein n=1 Tax=Triparma verrucosa TaxID=1606542 RepID=A0A9W7FAR0_9STRA|nr:hypothetical protein TrVE_jg4979 [Triparma verrucosa]